MIASDAIAAARRGAVNGGALGALIALILLTVVFSIVAYIRAEDGRITMEGTDGEDPFGRRPEVSLKSMMAKNRNKVDAVETLRRDIESRRNHIDTLDYRLAGKGAYLDDEEGWITGTDDTKGPWGLTKHDLETKRQYLHHWRDYQMDYARTGYPKLEDLANELRTQGRAVQEKTIEVDDRLKLDIDKLEADVDAYVEEKAGAEEVHRIEKSARQIEVSKLDRRIRELLELRLRWLKDIEADVKVLRVDLGRKFVIVDRGAAEGIFPGLKFEIFQYVKGQIQVKGMVEVTELDAHSSVCRILEEYDPKDNPIVRLDQGGNPVFDPDDTKTFVFAGEFKLYNRKDMEAFIREMGANVSDRLVPGIDFLVAGERSEDFQDAAREYQVTAMTEEQLVKYLTKTFGRREARE